MHLSRVGEALKLDGDNGGIKHKINPKLDYRGKN